MFETYLTLKQFLKIQCQKANTTITEEEKDKLCSSFKMSRNWMEESVFVILISIIRGLYELEIIKPITEEEAYLLHKIILEEVRGKDPIINLESPPDKPNLKPKESNKDI
jgi:hypothetical protein